MKFIIIRRLSTKRGNQRPKSKGRTICIENIVIHWCIKKEGVGINCALIRLILWKKEIEIEIEMEIERNRDRK